MPGLAAFGATLRCRFGSVLNDLGGRLRSEPHSALICIQNRRPGGGWVLLAAVLVAMIPTMLPQSAWARPKKAAVVPPLLVVSRPWPPVVTVRATVGTGSLQDPAGLDGLANLCWSTALRGAGSRDRAQLAEALEALGARVDVSVDKLGATIIGEVLADQLDAFLPLFADIVRRPRLEPSEIDEARQKLLADLVHIRDSDESLAHDAIGRYLFRGTRLGRPTPGTPKTLAAIKPSDIKTFHARSVAAGNVRLGMAGAIDETQARALVEAHFGDLPQTPRSADPKVVAPDTGGRRLLILDKPRRSQAQVLLAQPLPPATHKDALPLLVANAILGGAFTSRLTHEIRELRGWSYNVWSALSAGRHVSTLVMGFGPANADTPPAIDLAVRIVSELQQTGITPAELRFAKDYLKGAHRFSLETADRELGMRMRAADLGLPPDEIDTFAARVEAVEHKTIQRVLRDHLQPDHLVAVVVGSARSLQDKLATAPAAFAVEVLPAAGAPETTTGLGREVGAPLPVTPETAPPEPPDDAEPEGPDEDGAVEPEEEEDPGAVDDGIDAEEAPPAPKPAPAKTTPAKSATAKASPAKAKVAPAPKAVAKPAAKKAVKPKAKKDTR